MRRRPDAGIRPPAGSQLPVVLRIQANGPDSPAGGITEMGVIAHHPEIRHLRTEPLPGEHPAETERMGSRRHKLPGGREGQFLQIGISLALLVCLAVIVIILLQIRAAETGVIQLGIGEQPGIHHAVPAERRPDIAPAVAVLVRLVAPEELVDTHVPAVVETEIKAVARGTNPIELRVEVIKRHARRDIPAIDNLVRALHQGIQPGITPGDQERSLVLLQRSLHGEGCRQRAEGKIARQALHVPLAHGHVQHGGEPPAVTGRDRPLVEGHRLQRLAVKSGEVAEQVVHVIDRHPVQQDGSLLRAAAPHADARLALHARIDTGQRRERAHQVRLPQDGRHRLDAGCRKLMLAHLRPRHKRTLAPDNDLLQPTGTLQGNVTRRICPQVHGQEGGKIPHIVRTEGIIARRKGQAVKTKLITHGTPSGAHLIKGGIRQTLAGGAVLQEAANRHILLRIQGRTCRQEKQANQRPLPAPEQAGQRPEAHSHPLHAGKHINHNGK